LTDLSHRSCAGASRGEPAGKVALVDGSSPSAPSDSPVPAERRSLVGSVIKKRRKRMAKKKHRKLLKKTRVQRRNKK
jgi:hypothetical protein